MWYEILPSLGIITGAITFPAIFNYYFSKLLHKGNPYRRDIQTNIADLGLFRRDTHLFGNPYIIKGLENIPDDE